MKTTKITKIGNSKGIIIPSEVIKALALEDGDEVELTYDPDTQILSSRFPHSKQLKLVLSSADTPVQTILESPPHEEATNIGPDVY